MAKSKFVSSTPECQPWVFTLVNTSSLQVTKVLALGRSAAIAELHVRKCYSVDDWKVDRFYRVMAKNFLCNADYSYPNLLIDF